MTQAPYGRSPQLDPTPAATLHVLTQRSDFCPEPRGGGRWAPTCGRSLWAPMGPLPSQAGLLPGHCHQHGCSLCSAPPTPPPGRGGGGSSFPRPRPMGLHLSTDRPRTPPVRKEWRGHQNQAFMPGTPFVSPRPRLRQVGPQSPLSV